MTKFMLGGWGKVQAQLRGEMMIIALYHGQALKMWRNFSSGIFPLNVQRVAITSLPCSSSSLRDRDRSEPQFAFLIIYNFYLLVLSLEEDTTLSPPSP